MEDKQEEEEALIVIELSGIVDNDFLHKKEKTCKMLGVNTSHPILQIDNYFFSGEYEDTIGTDVIFEEVSVPNTIFYTSTHYIQG
ncbi:general transcription factor 3C polypeptide 6-like [Centruroides sculpturatus]|uniref:general transcription factor 3C polypeptide 6-like n=1 Tax=Centruroides sculpturatus TaxID=218467 RepID=UPI000C6D5CCE|nr:general transcription factor 3C polypeptide 6-like [Centruroides sculpturatus]